MLPPYKIWSILPHLQSTESPFQHNDSPHLFSSPCHHAYDSLVERGAGSLLQDPPDKDRQHAAGQAHLTTYHFDSELGFKAYP